MYCNRCKKQNSKLLFLSVFNEDLICVSCKETEEKHRDYKKAIQAIEKEENKGNYDFKGIGIPDDLLPN